MDIIGAALQVPFILDGMLPVKKNMPPGTNHRR